MANERRLIDANALKIELKKSAEYHEVRRLGLYSAMTHIDEQPNVDAVEVRCKDCKHMEITPDNLRWCNVWERFNGAGDEGYCNYGEKRESGTQPQREDV